MLLRLELSGFKSFARSTTLEFKTPITAIVGPNGAGKSNIAEAIRFVLGEQSIKSLRGKKSEDLIFHGTKTIPRLGKAAVAVTFDNRKKIFDLDYDEVEIRRVVYRDSLSEYFVNGSRTRLKDIIELLSSVYIGASSHHIISQGEADRILNASIKERRTMIEDALGLKVYQYKRAESERKLRKTEEYIAQVRSLQQEVAPHLQFLEKQVEKIRQAESLRDELRILFQEYLADEKASITRAYENLFREKKLPQEELEAVEREIARQEAYLKEKNGHQKKAEEIFIHEENLRALHERIGVLSRQLGRAEGILELEETRIKKSTAVVAEGESVIIPKREIQNLTEKIIPLCEEGSASEDVSYLKNIIIRVKDHLSSFVGTYIKNKSSATGERSVEETYENAKTEKEILEEKLEKLRKEEKETSERYMSGKRELEEERGTERIRERALFELRSKRTEIQTRLELLQLKEERVQERDTLFKKKSADAEHYIGKEGLSSLSVPTLQGEGEIDEGTQETRRRKIERVQFKLEDIGEGSSEITKEYAEVKERDAFLSREIEDLRKSAESLQSLISELGVKIDTEFKEGVKKINKEFQELFFLMFGGGTASMKIISPPAVRRRKKDTDIEEEANQDPRELLSEDVPEEGIEINVSLPSKRVKGLTMLSGGERALTSIALICAITQVKPPPFLVLDETDAALDEANSRKYASLLESLSKHAQLLIITHNRETMSRAGVLYGVTSTADGISRLLSIRIEEAVEIAE